METKINMKSTLIISTLIALIVLGIGIGYAYFAAQGTTISQQITSGNLSVGFNTTNILRTSGLIPIKASDVDSKATLIEFSVQNKGDITGYFDISLTELTIDNELKDSYFKWRLQEGDTVISEGNFVVADNTKLLQRSIKIEKTITKNYKLLVWLEESNQDQNHMQNKSLTAKVTVDAKDRLTNIAQAEDLTLTNTISGNSIQNLKMYGNTVNGVGVGDTKNLFNKNDSSILISGYPVYQTGVLQETTANSRSIIFDCEPNTTYTFSKQAGKAMRIVEYSSSPEIGSTGSPLFDPATTEVEKYSTATITTSSTGEYIVWFIYNTTESDTVELQDILNSMQIEKGNTATEYEPYGYTIPVTVRGKNMFDVNQIVDRDKIKNNQDGTLTIIGNAANSARNLSIICPELKAGDEVTLSATSEGRNIIYLIGSKYTWNFGTAHIITQEELNSGIYFYAKTVDETVEPVVMSNIQIEKGTTATTYEPYQEPQTYTITLSAPLRSNGDKKDYIDFNQGKVIRWIDESGNVLSTPTEETITLPEIKTLNYTTIISTDTSVKPTIEGSY